MAAALAIQAALIAAVAFAAIVVFADGLGLQDFLYTSDSANGFLMAGDILRDPASYFRWVLPPSYYLVPDIALAVLIVAAGVDPLWQMPVFYSLIAAAQCLAVGLILSQVHGVTVAFGMWAWAALLVLVAWVDLAFAEPAVSTQVMLRAPLLFSHSGTLTLSLWGLWLVLRGDGTGKLSPGVLLSLLALTAIATFSDLIFIGWFVAPAILALVVAGLGTRTPAFFRLALVIGVTALAAAILEHFFNPSRQAYLNINELSLPISVLSDYAGAIVSGPDIAGLLALGALLAAGIRALVLIARPRAGNVGDADGLASLFLGTGAVGALAGFVLLGLTIDTIDYRFLMPAFVYPFLWLFLRLFRKPLPRPAAAVGLAAVPVLAAGVIALTRFDTAPPPVSRSHAELIRCLDAEGRVAGLSDYWDAMALMQATGGRIHAVSIAADGLGYLWNVNLDWYFWRRDTGAAANFDYVIMRRLDPAKIAVRYGVPDREITCADRTVWLYDRPVYPRGDDPENPS